MWHDREPPLRKNRASRQRSLAARRIAGYPAAWRASVLAGSLALGNPPAPPLDARFPHSAPSHRPRLEPLSAEPIMPLPRQVAPTLVDAVCALEGDTRRGFVFVRPDGSERLRSFDDMANESRRRAAAPRVSASEGRSRRARHPRRRRVRALAPGDPVRRPVPVPLYPQLSFNSIEAYHSTVAHIARAAGAAVLLTTAAEAPYLEAVLGRVDGLRALVTVDELAASKGAMRWRAVTPDDLALIQFTSGSTARPKGVMVTHANLAANAEAFMIHGLDRDPDVDKGVSWLPALPRHGPHRLRRWPPVHERSMCLLADGQLRAPARMWLDKIHEHRGTITYAPSFAYALVAKRLKDKDVQGLDLSCLRICGLRRRAVQPQALRISPRRLAPARFDPRRLRAVVRHGRGDAGDHVYAPRRRACTPTMVDGRAPGRRARPFPRRRPRTRARSSTAASCSRVTSLRSSTPPALPGRATVGQIVARGPERGTGRTSASPSSRPRPFKSTAGRRAGEVSWLHTGDLGLYGRRAPLRLRARLEM